MANSTTPTLSTQEAFNQHQGYLAQLGRLYPSESIFQVSEQIESALEHYFQAISAPSEVTELVETSVMLYSAGTLTHAGVLSDVDAAGLVENLASAASLLDKVNALTQAVYDGR